MSPRIFPAVAVILGLSAAAPAEAMELSASRLVQGAVGTFTVRGAEPGALVVLTAGSRWSSDCPAGIEVCIRPGVEIGRAVADARGTAVVAAPIRARVAVGDYLFQAVVRQPVPSASAVVQARVEPFRTVGGAVGQ